MFKRKRDELGDYTMPAATQRVRVPAHFLPAQPRKKAAPKATRKPDPIKRPFLCLQVRTDDGMGWGALSAIRLHTYTDPKAMRDYRKELNDKKVNWMRSNYFGGTASFRIEVEERIVQNVVVQPVTGWLETSTFRHW